MDIELRNDRIHVPRNPFDRQFLDMTSPVNIFLMQYLEIQIVTGNALYVPKDQLNHQGYLYNSWVGVLHVFTVNFMPFIKNKIYLQFTNCATQLSLRNL